MEPTRRKLRNFLIHRQLQFKLIFTSALYMLIVCVITMGVVQFPLVYDMVFMSDINIQYRAAEVFLLVANRLIPAMICVFLLFFLHQVIVTHHMCGPLINFARTFEKVGQGDLTRKVRLRRHDYLHKESAGINRMVDSLSQLLLGIQAESVNLRLAVEGAVTSMRAVDNASVQEHMGKIENRMRQLETRLAEFKLPA